MIPERAFDEARLWLRKARCNDAKALAALESCMGGYGLARWGQRMIAEQVVALIRIIEAGDQGRRAS